MTTRLVIGFVFIMILQFFNAVVVFNLTEQKLVEPVERGMYWMTFCIVFYSFFKSAMRFKDDFLLMLEDKAPNEETSYKYHKKIFTPLIGMTFTIAIGNILKI